MRNIAEVELLESYKINYRWKNLIELQGSAAVQDQEITKES